MKKHILSFLAMAVMLMTLLAVGVSAKEFEVSDKSSLTNAIFNANDGETITLSSDIEYTDTTTLTINKAITLDLGGHTLTTNGTSGGLSLKNNCTLKNGTLIHQGTVAAIKAWNVEAIEDVTIDVKFKEEGKVIGGIVIQQGTGVSVDTIKNVTIKGEGLTNGIETYNCGNAAQNVIGSMENVTINAVGTGMLISAPCGTATNCTINGGVSGIEIWIKGTYSAKLNLVNCAVNGDTQAVYAHDEFNSYPAIQNNGALHLTTNDATTFNANSNAPVLRKYIVRAINVIIKIGEEDAVAEVNGTKYTTLAEAVKAANEDEGGATVTLLADVTLDEKLTISGNVTIEGEYTITRADDYTGTLFTVNAGATLTLDGGLTIDGGNVWVMDMETYNADLTKKTQVSKDDAGNYFTPEAGAPVATAYMITTSGTVNLNKVTIQNNYSTGSGIVSASKGAIVTLTGTTITHNANVTNSGLVVNASAGVYDVNGNNEIIVTMNDGTVIDGNHVGGNHGVFKIYTGTHFIMNGGEIKNTTGWNSNGVAVGVYWAAFTMNGGTICSNSSVYGSSNGRNAAVYLHSASQFVMNDGTVCHNSGRARGGIDAPHTGIEGNVATAVIHGGNVVDNISIGGNTNQDVYGGEHLTITGGTFTQDVTKWVPENYECYLYDPDSGRYTVVPAGERNPVDLTVINGKYINLSVVDSDVTKPGDIITITTELKEDHYFEGWNVVSGNVIIPDENKYDTEYTFTMPDGDVVIEAVFRKIAMPTFTPMVAVTATAGEGGSISYEGRTSVILGMTRTYKITADEGYEIADVKVNGKSVGAVSKYEYEAKDLAADKIVATFEKINDAE